MKYSKGQSIPAGYTVKEHQGKTVVLQSPGGREVFKTCNKASGYRPEREDPLIYSGAELAAIMKKSGVSASSLAKLLGIRRAKVIEWLKGVKPIPAKHRLRILMNL